VENFGDSKIPDLHYPTVTDSFNGSLKKLSLDVRSCSRIADSPQSAVINAKSGIAHVQISGSVDQHLQKFSPNRLTIAIDYYDYGGRCCKRQWGILGRIIHYQKVKSLNS
jgi:hypothetical protein